MPGSIHKQHKHRQSIGLKANSMSMTTNPREIIMEVGQWATNNFGPYRDSDYGLVEEIGEKVHGVLKRIQRIRGFEVDAHFYAHVKDALGDAMVYLSDWCAQRNAFYQVPDEQAPLTGIGEHDFRRLLKNLLRNTSMIVELSEDDPACADAHICSAAASRVAMTLWAIACIWNLNLLRDCLYPTWHQVKERNWKKNPVNADKVAVATLQ